MESELFEKFLSMISHVMNVPPMPVFFYLGKESDSMSGFFSSIVSTEIRKAFTDRKSVRMSVSDAEGLSSYILSDECVADLTDIGAGRYEFAPPERIAVNDRNGKRRLVFRYSGRDAMLLSLIAYHLHQYDSRFGTDLYSHRLDKNVHGAILRIRTQSGIHRMYAYKTDIKSYGESISLNILQNELARFINDDPELLRFLCAFSADDTYTDKGEVFHGAPAVRQGCPLTGFLENVYLAGLDTELAGAADVYCRYNDDMIFYASGPERLDRCRKLLTDRLAQLGLRENTAKAAQAAPGEFVRFICFDLAGNRMDLCGNQVYIWKKSLDGLVREMLYLKRKYCLSDDLSMFLTVRKFEEVRNRYVALMPFLTESSTLKLFDHLFLDAIRTVGNSGPGKSKYRIPYSKIKELGYESLVHEYYSRKGTVCPDSQDTTKISNENGTDD